MEVGSTLSQLKESGDPRNGPAWEEGYIYDLLICPACQEVTLRRYYWHELMEPDEAKVEFIFPSSPHDLPLGLPLGLRQEYEAALKVRAISPNAYGVLLGRLLELICEERKAKGGGLSARLKKLADRGEIPERLVKVAESLQQLRHVGAHATLGELTPDEIPILDRLCRALLEYLYSAPYLIQEAEERLQHVRAAQRRTKKDKEKGV